MNGADFVFVNSHFKYLYDYGFLIKKNLST
ncbi:hypothetical protein KEN51_CDS0377 [Pseudomonas phage vB_Pae10145-KEN51]|nr:hypothetical protein IPCDMZAV_CDS0293 [Pseudomonas phage 6B]WRQ06313.1 hypothetical protein QAMIJHJT_CDS0382 [Pseudomonas phage 9-Ps-8B]WRQ06721.1 hypothetical protein FOPPYZMZ_CDS0381 [Pseudomonas phage 9Ps-7B]WRQ07072.1 hypothetical protein ZBUARNPM_CDS0323 [Pseudomonas phage 14Ps5-6]